MVAMSERFCRVIMNERLMENSSRNKVSCVSVVRAISSLRKHLRSLTSSVSSFVVSACVQPVKGPAGSQCPSHLRTDGRAGFQRSKAHEMP